MERPASGVRSPGTPEERLPGIHTLSPFVVKKGESKTMRQGPFYVCSAISVRRIIYA